MKPRLIEKYWDCPFCGTVGILGRHADCPHCGARRPGGIEFYRKELNYVDEETAKTISRNPDWCCSYCNGLNSDKHTECQTCGATREASDKNYFDKLKEKKAKEEEDRRIMESYNTHNYDGSVKETPTTSTPIIVEDQKAKNSSFIFKKLFMGLGIGLGSILFIALLIFIFTPKEKTITIDGFSWEREIAIERYQTVNEEGWTLPTSARLHRSEERIKEYRQVIDRYETKSREVAKERLVGYEDYVSGYRDLGNGYEEEIISQRPIYETYYETETWEEPVYRDEPVYATYFYYEIDKWLYERSVETQEYDQEPYWGETNLKDDEREQGRREKYLIHFTDEDEKAKEYSIDYTNWSNLEKGQTLNVKVSFGEIVEIIGVDMVDSEELNTSSLNTTMPKNNIIKFSPKKTYGIAA